MGQLTMEIFVKKFINLQWYFTYLKEDEVIIQHVISYISQYYKDKFDFSNPKTMDETIRHEKLLWAV